MIFVDILNESDISMTTDLRLNPLYFQKKRQKHEKRTETEMTEGERKIERKEHAMYENSDELEALREGISPPEQYGH